MLVDTNRCYHMSVVTSTFYMGINFARIYFEGFLISQFFTITKNAKLKTREIRCNIGIPFPSHTERNALRDNTFMCSIAGFQCHAIQNRSK